MEPPKAEEPIKFLNILLATDFSSASQNALLRALTFARRWRARLFVTHVVNPSTMLGHEALERAVNDAWREAHTQMTDQLIAGRLEGVENHVIVRSGETWVELEKMITEFHIDLLVTGTHGRSGVWKMLLGSTAETIFRNATIPVLTVGPKSPEQGLAEGPRRVLYTTGLAAQSLYADRFACEIAERYQAQLAILHVIENMPADSAQTRDRLRLENEGRLRSLLPSGAQLAKPPDIIVEFGAAAENILDVAERWHPDVIVVGLRRRSRDAGRMVSATAYAVVSKAPCPVLTVRTPEEA